MRLFIAIPIPPPAAVELRDVLAKLISSGADYKWVHPDQFHMTLSFLGEVPPGRRAAVEEALEAACAGFLPFEMRLVHIGAFASLEHPRVVWIGAEEGSVESSNLADHLRKNLEKAGFALEKRKFEAHATVGRMRSPRNIEGLKRILADLGRSGAFCGCNLDVSEVVLYESRLTPQGPVHTALRRQPLPSLTLPSLSPSQVLQTPSPASGRGKGEGNR